MPRNRSIEQISAESSNLRAAVAALGRWGWKGRLLTGALLCFGLLLGGGSFASELAPREGYLLVAREAINDPRFRQSVVLLVQHDQRGSMGLILNRPSRALPQGLLPGIPDGLHQLYYGGPVEPFTASVLLRSHRPPERSRRLLEDIHLTGPAELLQLLKAESVGEFRIFFGYAGWAPGQLAMELSRGHWQVLPAEGRLLFQRKVDQLWQQLRERGPVIRI